MGPRRAGAVALSALLALSAASASAAPWPGFRGSLTRSGAVGMAEGSRGYGIWGGVPRVEWSCEMGDWVFSSPAVADVDEDGAVEVLIGSYDNRTYCLGVVGRTFDPVVGISIPIVAALAAWATVRRERSSRGGRQGGEGAGG